MTPIYDLDECMLSYKNASYGGSRKKEGIIFNNKEWLVKYPHRKLENSAKAYSSYQVSEYIGSHIYDILGYDVQNTILGIRNNTLVVGCEDFATNGRILMEMKTIKNVHIETADIDLSLRNYSGNDVDELMFHFDNNPVLQEIPNIKRHFFEQAIIDIFIGNACRYNDNWGIIRQKDNAAVPAPIYSNGNCFELRMSDEQIREIITKSEFTDLSIGIMTAYTSNGKALSVEEFIEKFSKDKCFINAIEDSIPLMNEKMLEITNLILEIPEQIINSNSVELFIISDIRKEAILKQMKNRFEILLMPLAQ